KSLAPSEIAAHSRTPRGHPPPPRQTPPPELPWPPPSKCALLQTSTPPAAAVSAPQKFLPCPRKSARCHTSLHCSVETPASSASPSPSPLSPPPTRLLPRTPRQSFPQWTRLPAPASANSRSSVSTRWCAQSQPAPRAAPLASSAQSLQKGPSSPVR